MTSKSDSPDKSFVNLQPSNATIQCYSARAGNIEMTFLRFASGFYFFIFPPGLCQLP